MPDSIIEVSIVTTGDTAGADKVAASVAKTTAEEQKLTAAAAAQGSVLQAVAEQLARDGQALDLTAVSTRAATESTNANTQSLGANNAALAQNVAALNESGMAARYASSATFSGQYAMLSFGKVVEDTQKSVFAMTRGLAMMAVSMGLGGGVAGAIYIASTAFQVLDKDLDQVSEKAIKATESVRMLAVAADKEADSSARAKKNLDGEIGAQESANEAYRKTISMREEAIQQRLRESAAARELLDAELALTKARIDADEASGKISPQDAEKLRRNATKETDTGKLKTEQDDSVAREEKALADAENQRREAERRRRDADQAEQAAPSVMSKDELFAAQKRLAYDEHVAQEAKQEAQKAKEALEWSEPLPGGLGPYGLHDPQRSIPKDTQAALDAASAEESAAQRAAKREKDKIEADKKAREAVGNRSKEELLKEAKKAREEADKLEETARKNEESAFREATERDHREKISGLRNQAADIESGVKVTKFDTRDSEKEAREKEKMARERAQIEAETRALVDEFDGDKGTGSVFVKSNQGGHRTPTKAELEKQAKPNYAAEARRIAEAEDKVHNSENTANIDVLIKAVSKLADAIDKDHGKATDTNRVKALERKLQVLEDQIKNRR